MWIQVLAAAALILVLWTLLRFALGLRQAKVVRELSRGAEEARGRRVVAEIPLRGDVLMLFLEDESAFYWGAEQARKPDLAGARMLLNGGVIGAFTRPGTLLPDPPPPEEYEGRERWDVFVYLRDGRSLAVPCGMLREGVSREIAARVFEALRAAGGSGRS